MKLAARRCTVGAARIWRDAWPGILLGLLVTLSAMPLAAQASDETAAMSTAQQQDPLDSPLWDYLRQRFIGAAPYRFDERIQVRVPPFAEDPFQVPISIDASALSGRIERILVWADFNPIQHIVTAWPQSELVRPQLSLRIKVEQGTPVRAAVLTDAGVWHVGGRYLNAAGGGCTAPSMAAGNPYWESHLGEIQARGFAPAKDGAARYKFRVIHPMDTGLVSGIPQFYIEQAELRGEDGTALMRLELSAPVSENPVLTFDTGHAGSLRLWMRDNNGNVFETPVAAPVTGG
ncbi:quinoprotein dehydrogenase-associated SoxYZ-like carrier [Marinobacterium rhizophilum]|uniref:Quinoprotein dehydrogenase-associated SoxYZ-like carrier n=1 Tax=Marinobacterium rhizophilum TaxID=420402 RepID=A0ABY5HNI0_9GAMM|nr:quinoprotein dehydrogenase-associated SoxYZ-like carrier [Marinobacterium rhizophilum]UTW13421.1 quinoprotein dehydrogenase-associated SoxYZ-like carrier [Marinobacterium rhizophilum]